MSYTSNIGGKLIVTAKGNINDFAKEDIVINSQKSINITGKEKGISYGKPKKFKPKTDLLITKVEGPFDEKGKLVDKIGFEKYYTYKATPSRNPTEYEIKMLRWATKSDDGKIKELGGTTSANQLDKEGKLLINVAINQDCEKARVYAYFKKASEKVSVEIKISDVFRPYIIAKSRHRKGMNEAGTGKHHDMMSRDMTDAEIIALNPDTKKWIDIVNKEGFKGIQKLSDEMADLLTDFSMGELEDVNLKMHKKFIKNELGDFEDTRLTQAAIDHEHTTVFFNRIKDNIILQLSENENFVFDKKLMSCLLQIKSPGAKMNRIDIPSPTYPDNYGGLGIAINDTWGYDIKITKFKQDNQKKMFSADFEIEIFDHYGLDSRDIDPNENGGFFDSASFEGFLCWFILQHKCGYKPFYTILKMIYKINNVSYSKDRVAEIKKKYEKKN